MDSDKTDPFLRLVRQAVRANKRTNLVYLNNPKVGCSTVKLTLWSRIRDIAPREIADIHDLAASPFHNRIGWLGWAERAQVFTFVRNPFARVVSAYLNKICAQDDDTRSWFDGRYGFAPGTEIGFGAFVEAIAGDDPLELDPHWRPQCLNVLAGLVTPNFIGHLECMDQDMATVLHQVFGDAATAIPSAQVHGTGANQKYRGYFDDKATRDRVTALYGEDFSRYGYLPDPAAPIQSRHDAIWTMGGHARLALLGVLKGSDDPVIKRDAADMLSETVSMGAALGWLDRLRPRLAA